MALNDGNFRGLSGDMAALPVDVGFGRVKVVNIGGPLDNVISQRSLRPDFRNKVGEVVMSPAAIVRRIDETIRDPDLPRDTKIEILENLAVAYWKLVSHKFWVPSGARELIEQDEG